MDTDKHSQSASPQSETELPRAGADSSRHEWLAFVFITAIFALSGCAALIYQVVWIRELCLLFGSTTLATGTVLTVFMGGLALGSLLAGRFGHKLARPLLTYALLEAVVGVWALFVPSMFEAAQPVYQWIWRQCGPSFIVFAVLRFIAVCAILLVPTTAMGATLPVISRLVATSFSLIGSRIGTLYGINAGGAVVGTVLTGFILIPHLGLTHTTYLAALMNISLAAATALASLRFDRPPKELDTQEKETTQSQPPPRQLKAALVAIGLSGAFAMVYEVAWTRALQMIIGSSTYSFTVMLAAFLVGISLGGLMSARVIDRAERPLVWLAIFELMAFGSGLAGLHLFNLLPWWNLQVATILPQRPEMALLARFFFAGLILLPLAMCLGAIFPAAIKAGTRDLKSVARSVGDLYAANTFGCIKGSFLTAFLLIPLVGVERSIHLAALGNLALAAGLLLMVRNVPLPAKAIVCLTMIAATARFVHTGEIWDRAMVLFAQPERRKLVRKQLAYASLGHFLAEVAHKGKVLFYKDGPASNVGVWQSSTGQLSLVTNGHVDGSDRGDMPVQVLLAAYPLLFKPDARDIAIVGWGTGVTVGTTTRMPVGSVTVIELEPAVIEASRLFEHVNYTPETDKRVHVEINDGRNWLTLSDKKFDMILSEPSNPWQAGVCNLFTKEYFEICKKRLSKGGIFACWLQNSEIPTANLRSVLQALRINFPHLLMIYINETNQVILASESPIDIKPAQIADTLSRQGLNMALPWFGIQCPEDLLGRIRATETGIETLVKGYPPNKDDDNQLEFAVARVYETYLYSRENMELLKSSPGLESLSFPGMTDAQKAHQLNMVAVAMLRRGRPRDATIWTDAAGRLGKTTDNLRLKGAVALALGNLKEANDLWDEALARQPNDITTYRVRCAANLNFGDLAQVAPDIERIRKIAPTDKFAQYAEASLSAKLGAQPQVTLNLLGGLPDDSQVYSQYHDVLYLAADANLKIGQVGKALKLVRTFLTYEPQSPLGARLLGRALIASGLTSQGEDLVVQSVAMAEQDAGALYSTAGELLTKGEEALAAQALYRALELYPKDLSYDIRLSQLAERNERISRLRRELEKEPTSK